MVRKGSFRERSNEEKSQRHLKREKWRGKDSLKKEAQVVRKIEFQKEEWPIFKVQQTICLCYII